MGVDRLVMILAGKEAIRDVIAFPKSQSGSDPLTGAPPPSTPPSCGLGLASIVEAPAAPHDPSAPRDG